MRFRASALIGRSMRKLSPSPGDEAISGVAWRTAVLDIGSLQPSDTVLVHGREFGAQIELVEARRVVAEDRALDCAVGGPERGKTILLPHILWDLEAAECLDLPLARTVPHRVRTPEYVIMPELFDQRAHHRGAEARVRDGRNGKGCADIGIDVADASFLWDRGEIRHPPDVATLFELRELAVGRLEECAKRRMVDHEIDLRPILGCLRQVVHIGVFPRPARDRSLVILRE